MEHSAPIKRMNLVEGLVKNYLQAYPELRDNFWQLTTNVWYSQMRKMGYSPEAMQAGDFFNMYQKGMLSSEETIQRCRRKLQERHEELRGERWEERKATEQQVRQEINENYESKFHQLNLF